jgi:hypothetical protein
MTKPPPEGKTRAKAGTVAKGVFAVLLGSGSVFSVVQWAVKGPEYDRQLQKLKVDQADADLKKSQLDSRLESLKILETKASLYADVHDKEIESFKRELDRLKQTNDSQGVRRIAAQLAERERSYRDLIDQLKPLITVQAVQTTAVDRAIAESRSFETSMRALSTSSSNGAAATGESRPLAFEQPVFDHKNRHICVPADSRVTAHLAGGAPETHVMIAGTLEFPAITESGIERVSPTDTHVLATVAAGSDAVFSTFGASRDKCSLLDVQVFKVQGDSDGGVSSKGRIVVPNKTTLEKRLNVKPPSAVVTFNFSGEFQVTITWRPDKDFAPDSL